MTCVYDYRDGHYYLVPYTLPSMPEGWECRRCGTVNAPWRAKCDCKPVVVIDDTRSITVANDWYIGGGDAPSGP